MLSITWDFLRLLVQKNNKPAEFRSGYFQITVPGLYSYTTSLSFCHVSESDEIYSFHENNFLLF